MSVGPYTKYKNTTLRALGIAFEGQRYLAQKRGVAFLFTFGQWLQIWVDSGHLLERGCRKGQYVMARFGDMGPYAVGNVKIVTCTENNREGKIGNKHALGAKRSSKTRKLIAKGLTGIKRSVETRKKLSAIATRRNKIRKRDSFGRYL